MDEARRICEASEVPEDSTLAFTFEDMGLEREGFLLRLDDGTVVAYLNECPHWTDTRLDRGDGAVRRSDEIVCQKHGATFQADDGFCDYGPCEGSVLPDVDVTVEDGGVYLADERTELLHRGIDDEGDNGSARAGGGRIDFGG